MVHELFNEDSGILPPQLKGPYGLQQLLAMTADRMWRSQLRVVAAIAPLYGRYMSKCSENMQNTHIEKLEHHQSLLFSCFPPLCCSVTWQSEGIQAVFPALCHIHFKQWHASVRARITTVPTPPLLICY